MKFGKRIVNKAEYAKLQRLRFAIIGLILCSLYLAILIFSDSTLGQRLFHGHHLVIFIVGQLVVVPACMLINIVMAIRIVVSDTHTNAADLPIDESLVRASQEPVQENQSILLRAASDANQTPAEQLLRLTE